MDIVVTQPPILTDKKQDFFALNDFNYRVFRAIQELSSDVGTIETDHGALAGLSDDDHTQYLRTDGTRELSGAWDAGDYAITATNFISDVAVGTSPYACTSTTLNSNLNADLWDGYEFADYLDQAVRTTDDVTFATVNTGQGANELYAMNQDVETTDSVQFGRVGINMAPSTFRLDITDVGVHATASCVRLEAGMAWSASYCFPFVVYTNGQLITLLGNWGNQEWYLWSGAAQVGSIAYSTPNGKPGIGLYTGSYGAYTNRLQWTNQGTHMTFGFNDDASGLNALRVYKTSQIVANAVDNSGFQTGAGLDCRIYYNGTNMVLDPQYVGSGHVVIGAGKAGVDYQLIFDGQSNDGTFCWLEDEDLFRFDDDIAMLTSEKIYFRDFDIGIYSQADSYMDLFADGAVRIGNSSAGAPTSYTNFGPSGHVLLPAGTATAGTAPLKFTSGTALTTPETGALEFHNDRLYITNVSSRRAVDRTNDIIIADTTVANTVTETTIYTSTIPANELKVRNVIKQLTTGVMSAVSAADVVTGRVKIGGTTIATLTSSGSGVLTNEPWHFQVMLTQRSLGATGAIAYHIDLELDGSADVGGTTTIDTTSSCDLTVTVQWNNAKAGNTLTIQQGLTEYKG